MMVLRQNIFSRDLAAWQAMEQASDAGLIRSLGLSGFSDVRNFDLFVSNAASIQPAVLMTALHPYSQQTDIRTHLDPTGTLLVSDAPLGEIGEEQVIFADPAVSVTASWYQKTSSQVILRWQLQSGNVFLPAVSDEVGIDEYSRILDFELSEEDMEKINALDRPLFFLYY
jgi:diketogulonate reductase-like aldo/keto reductase